MGIQVKIMTAEETEQKGLKSTNNEKEKRFTS